jgi:hypothetical protein
MKPFRMMLVAGILLGAISCTKEDDQVAEPGSSAQIVQGTVIDAPVKGAYLISRFEQDGVENPEMREQELDFYDDGKVVVKGRNYEYTGQWSYDSAKKYIKISMSDRSMQAQAVSSDNWQVISASTGEVKLKANIGNTSKTMELKVKRDVAKL